MRGGEDEVYNISGGNRSENITTVNSREYCAYVSPIWSEYCNNAECAKSCI